MHTTPRLPAEWEAQDGVLLAWPHAQTDWADDLENVTRVFSAITKAISRFEQVLIVTPDSTSLHNQLAAEGLDTTRVTLFQAPSNDTWSRDFGPITVIEQGHPKLLDFGFNGWGLKFAANHDNRMTRRLAKGGLLRSPLVTPGLILEGGSIESDGRGTLLTTTACLLEANRNPHLSREQLEMSLKELLGVEQILWLGHGYLAGDDTDSHIDTLARLAPDDTILYVSCPDQEDEHFPALHAMEQQLRTFRTRKDAPFRLLPLPWPRAIYDQAGERLPATYANFLVINDAVLVPVYNDPADDTALSTIGSAFPGREVIAVDCRALIQQHGSLHCVTMQLPEGVLA